MQSNDGDWGDKEGTVDDRRILDDLIKEELKKSENKGNVITVEVHIF